MVRSAGPDYLSSRQKVDDLPLNRGYWEGNHERLAELPERGARWEDFGYANIQNVLEDIEISLHNNGSPVEGRRVQVTAKWIYRSGDHYHEGSK